LDPDLFLTAGILKRYQKGWDAMGALKEMTMLLVDDDESIRISMEYYFKQKTALFRAVETAELGMKTLREMGGGDIVIADYKLPGMNGLSFLETVTKQWPNAITILITAHSSAELKSEAMRIGIGAFIQKPFATQAIMDAVMAV
jgi:DNA-binding NtrC family response regulator